jgi:hypothetical protein
MTGFGKHLEEAKELRKQTTGLVEDILRSVGIEKNADELLKFLRRQRDQKEER